jgi:alkylation response protein AidB-like acyl-CoA dehydrogenase
VAERWGFQTATPVLGRPLRHREGGAAELAAWWRLSTSAEIVGLADAALRCVADHLGQRVQFGRSLTAQQALRHRLAVLRVRVDGSRLLTYRAAWSGADAGQSLEAAAYTASTGRHAVRDLHQMCGAIGLTEEYALQRWTTRIVVLCSELGGAVGQQRALARHRWPASSGPIPS